MNLRVTASAALISVLLGASIARAEMRKVDLKTIGMD